MRRGSLQSRAVRVRSPRKYPGASWWTGWRDRLEPFEPVWQTVGCGWHVLAQAFKRASRPAREANRHGVFNQGHMSQPDRNAHEAGGQAPGAGRRLLATGSTDYTNYPRTVLLRCRGDKKLSLVRVPRRNRCNHSAASSPAFDRSSIRYETKAEDVTSTYLARA